MIWNLVTFLAGVVVGIILGVVIDKDTLLKVGRIKIKGRGHQVDHLLDMDEDFPERISRRKVRKLNKLKRKLKK